ncbi:GATA-binding factor 2 [Dissophora globulifera]|uniref:GATA-binding factor 2 n=1 Tax=Dissophora globulifera TaxID=979702 RepID=A0A9P6RSM4_9FUNG|nr:GATA-binding factor 2 [Dissophora globulifera]
MAFSRFIPGTDNNSEGHAQLQPLNTAASNLSLVGVCTVRIGPHMFLDTKFYTAVHPPAPTPHTNAVIPADEQGGLGPVKSEPGSLTRRPLTKASHRVVMEFKENLGVLWLFPEEASLEFTPADDHEAAQIAASFSLPIPPKSDADGRDTEPTHQATTLVILHATTALREGLELAVKGIHTTHRSSSHRPRNQSSRAHTPSTYSEDPSEVLGSGKQVIVSNNSVLPAKRKSGIAADDQKPANPKRPKDEEVVSSGLLPKKSTGGGSKRDGTSGASLHAAQKRCGYCDCTTTPMWRRGPNGPSTLCNACGVKWKHGKILQDSNDTPQKSGTTSSATPLVSSTSSASTKAAKERVENGHGRHVDDKKSHSKTAVKKASHSHDVLVEEGSRFKDDDNVIRSIEPERIVPVKKRLSGKVTPANPPGPRMVPIHELGDPTKTPSKFPTEPRKHAYEDDVSLPLNGRTRPKKNGVVQADHKVGTASSSTSSASTLSISQGHAGLERKQEQDALSKVSTHPPEDGLSLYSKNHYNNNTATFPLHFPTISIAFGPSNAYYTYPNCAVVLYENHFQIKLIQGGERTEIDVWKEGIEGTEFQVVDVGDGESMIIMKALLRQYLTRFDKELLNPDRNESLIVFRFRERLEGGGPSVKPLLEHWLATDIPVPPATSQ